jgi:Tol biopolymer transport system component
MSPLLSAAAFAALLAASPSEIAFTRGGNVHVVATDTDGPPRALTTGLSFDRPIVWSPDGQTLVYWNHDAGWNLFAVDAKGEGQRNLTKQKGGDCRSAAFSPDGRLIAFLRGSPPGVYAMDREGNGQRLVVGKGHRDQPPSFSPDGKSVAYMDLTSMEDGSVRTEVRVVSLDGSGDRPLAHGSDPQWARDGKTILFSGRGPHGYDLVAVPASGGGDPVPIAPSPETEMDPRLSPDGRFVAFNAMDADGKTELRVAALPGTETASVPAPRKVALIEGRAEPPTWSQCGAFVAFVSGGALFVAPVSGDAPPRKIADGGVHSPAWRPADTLTAPDRER